MKTLKFFLLSCMFLYGSFSYCTDTVSIKYMPMHVGDFWVYNGAAGGWGGSYSFVAKCSVTGTKKYNNHLYFCFYTTDSYLFSGYFRTDSVTGSLYRYDSTGFCAYYYFEKLRDSLAANVSDTIRNCVSGNFICTYIGKITSAGLITVVKTFYSYTPSTPYGYTEVTKKYAMNLGLQRYYTYSYGGGGGGGYGLILKGCRINGVVYGDTSLTDIRKKTESVPGKFFLEQNYPNPFNPYTVIKFGLHEKSQTSIKVYDSGGKEICSLLNENLQPGVYETTWNASKYSSGIYFYKIMAGEFTQTRKMVLVK